MWVRQNLHPAVVACLPSTRPLNKHVLLTGWPHAKGCFSWAVESAEEKAVCRFFPDHTPNEIALAEKAGALTGGEYEDIQLDDNWGFEALKALRERIVAPLGVNENLAVLTAK
jgi:hypothetical protein